MKWTVGKVTITRVIELEIVGSTGWLLPLATEEEARRLPWLVPRFAADDGQLKMASHSLIVETPQQRIVVDTGFGNDKQGRPVPEWNNMKTPYLEKMEAAGFSPDSIDAVLCTHLHVDHVGWNTMLVDGKWVPTFPKARYIFGKTEYDYWRDHSAEQGVQAIFDDSVKPIVDAGRAELCPSEHRFCEEVSTILTPGHSPGHMSILIESEGERALFAGDAAHNPIQMAHLDWSSTLDTDPQQAAATRRELFARFADTPTLVIGGHYREGYIKREGDAFRFVSEP